jgi:EAL domain-containing protein (putative c-di-GMP-specific phosphodiesterase class I)
VQRIGAEEGSAELVRAIVSVATSLSMDVTAEGIETAEQLACINALACRRGQGYFFSRPLDAAAVEAWLAAHCGRNPADAPDEGLTSTVCGIRAEPSE